MKEELLTAAAAELDRAGFMPLPGESAERFFERFRQSEEAFAPFETALAEEGGVSVFDEDTAAATGYYVADGYRLMELLTK